MVRKERKIIMKRNTDIEQSKKLIELGIDVNTADMYYPNRTDIQYQGALPIGMKHGNSLLAQEIPAWSLAALLDILSKTAHSIDEDGSVDLCDYKDIEWSLCLTNTSAGLVTANNPVDACYQMIIKLHEIKMLCL